MTKKQTESSRPMYIDIAESRTLWIISACCACLILVALIFGVFGPEPYITDSYFAYDCPDDNHTWDSSVCKGAQLGNVKNKLKIDFPKVNWLNGYIQVDMFPYNRFYNSEDDVDEDDLTVEVSLYGYKGSSEYYIRTNDTHTEQLECQEFTYGAKSHGMCEGFVLLYEEKLEYEKYQMEVRLANTSATNYIGDIEFTFSRFNANFTVFMFVMRIFFFFMSTAMMGAFLSRIRHVPLLDWKFEQRMLFFLLPMLCLYNLPIELFLYWVKWAWFWRFMLALFSMSFHTLLLLFWLLAAGKLKQDEKELTSTEPSFGLGMFVKSVFVLAYLLLGIILLNIINIRDLKDPVFSSSSDLTFTDVLYYIVEILYTFIAVWILVLCVTAAPVVVQDSTPYVSRFVFLVIPSCFVLVATLGSVYLGTYTPFSNDYSTFSFVFFQTLYNVLIALYVIGYWPIDDKGYVNKNPTETSGLSTSFAQSTKYTRLDEGDVERASAFGKAKKVSVESDSDSDDDQSHFIHTPSSTTTTATTTTSSSSPSGGNNAVEVYEDL